jgi:ribosomal protein S18 acetylase RimI-like enzyme
MIQFSKITQAEFSVLDELCHGHALYEHATYKPQENLKLWEHLMLGEHPKINCYLVKDENQVAGYFSFTTDYSTWTAEKFLYLDCLYLKESYRGRGIGTQVMSFLQELARVQGYRNIQWQTPNFNVEAIRFYKRTGAKGKEKIRFTLSEY